MRKDEETVQPNRLSALRQRAKARLAWEATEPPEMSPQETEELLHELRTHQIELEMQNDELRRAEEELVDSRDRYSDLYDFAPVGYATTSSKGLILEANLTLAGMLSVDRNGLAGQPLSAFIVHDDQDVFYLHKRSVLVSKQHAACRLRMIRRDTEPFWAEMDSILIEADDGSSARLRTVISDITERKQAETERQALDRRLQHAQKLESLGVLAGGIAHDFNNLLMAIEGHAWLALDALTHESPARDHLLEIEKASMCAAELSNQMLAYSGRGHFVVEQVDVGKLVKEVALLLDVSISKKAKLRFELAKSLSTFNGDAAQIRQVVMNLITNASEAIGDASGVISLSTGAIECDRAYLDDFDAVLQANLDKPLPTGVYTYLEVADTGCGMSPETVEKIFDPFFTTKFMGRGLGMSAVLGILRGHGGAIRIRSEVGKGSTFTILFPAHEPPLDGSEIRSEAQAPTETKNWRGSGTVLLADDEEAVRSVTKLMIERLGFSVLAAPNGLEALNLFREHADQIVCVLLDLTMPEMDGAETFREMRRLRPGVKVILSSGYSVEDATERFDCADLAGHIQKPFDLERLEAALGHALQRPNT